MPLYVHATLGERKRTVPGSYEDQRCQADPLWVRASPATVEQAKAAIAEAAPDEAEAAPDEPAKPAKPARRRPRTAQPD